MPKSSRERTNARRDEIVDACAQLYETVPFKEITLGAIGAKTSFTRTSIYNYFHTKEEIFLALLEREYRNWTDDLLRLANRSPMPRDAFSAAFAALLENRRCMLKLLSMNLYDMEAGSRIENLVAFKKVYNASMQAVISCLLRHCPPLSQEEAMHFLYAFYPFLFGIYPYTAATEKQITAMELAGVPYRRYSVTEITQAFVEKLLPVHEDQTNDPNKISAP